MYAANYSLCADVLQSDLCQRALKMGLEPSLVKRITLEKISRTGSGHSSLQALVEDCFNSPPPSDAAKTQEKGTVAPAVLLARHGHDSINRLYH